MWVEGGVVSFLEVVLGDDVEETTELTKVEPVPVDQAFIAWPIWTHVDGHVGYS